MEAEKDNYKQCYDNLFKDFVKMDMEMVAKASGSVYDKEENRIIFSFLGKNHTLNCTTGQISPCVSRNDLLIITHFLRYETYKDTKLTGELISLKEAPGGGALFYPAFKEMAVDPLARAFGGCASDIYKAAEALCGVKADLGSASITVNVFKNVPVTLVIWEGDEEIPAAATILYDKSVSDYAHIEDVIGIGITAAENAIRVCGKAI